MFHYKFTKAKDDSAGNPAFLIAWQNKQMETFEIFTLNSCIRFVRKNVYAEQIQGIFKSGSQVQHIPSKGKV